MNKPGFYPRTFSLAPSTRMPVAANLVGHRVRKGEITILRPANPASFRIGHFRRPELATFMPVGTGQLTQFWSRIVPTYPSCPVDVVPSCP